jgi:hypothetical protein
MSQYGGDNQTHKGNVSAAESTRQVAVAAAGTSQSAVNTAEIAFYRTCVASAKANGVGSTSVYMDALRWLGTGGA